MSINRKKKRIYSLTDFFNCMMDQIGQIILTNVIYSIPVIVFFAVIIGLSFVVPINIFIVLLVIPIMSPFTAGLFYAAKRVTMREELKAVCDFKKGMAMEWKPFLINGIISYVVTCGIYITMQIYRGGLSEPVILVSFIMSAIFVLFFVCFENAFLTMLVTVDIKPKEAVKNAVLMFIGGLLYHLKAIISLLFVIFVIYSVFTLIGDVMVSVIVLAVPLALFLPVLCANIVVYNLFQTIEKHIVAPFNDAAGSMKTADTDEEPSSQLSYEELMEHTKGDPEEYVYIGGRMLKRKTIIQMAEEKRDE